MNAATWYYVKLRALFAATDGKPAPWMLRELRAQYDEWRCFL